MEDNPPPEGYGIYELKIVGGEEADGNPSPSDSDDSESDDDEDDEEEDDEESGGFYSDFPLPNKQSGGVRWYAASIGECTELESVNIYGDESNSETIESGSRKQLKVPGGLVDVISTSGVLVISLYTDSAVGPKSGSFYTTPGTSYMGAVITQGPPATYVLMKDGNAVGAWTLVQGENPPSYTLQDNTKETSETIIRGGVESNGDRSKIVQTRKLNVGGGDQLVSSTKSIYHKFEVDTNWDDEPDQTFERIVKSVTDPDGAALTTEYGYQDDPWAAGYKKVLWVRYPDGDWEWNQYESLPFGVKIITWKPFKNTAWPSAVPATDAGMVKNVAYNDGTSETYIEGHLVSKSGGASGTGSFSGQSGLKVHLSQQWASPSGSPLVSRSYYSNGSLVATVNADRSATKYETAKGAFNPSTGAFTVGSGSDVRTTVSRGSVASVSGNDAGSFSMLANKSTISESIENAQGLTVQERSLFWDGSAAQIMQTLRYSYDGDDNLVETKRDGVVVDSAIYTGDEMQSSTDEFGVVSTTNDQGLTTTYTSDDGKVTHVSTIISDVAGRVVSRTSGGLTTQYAYSVAGGGGRIVTATLPSGATSITEFYRDGQIKSETGTGEVARSYDYGSVDGKQTTTETTGSRVVTTEVDMLGRMTKITEPKFGSGTTELAYSYNGSGQLASVARDGGSVEAPRLFAYDALGSQQLGGYDMDASGTLDTGSSSADRVDYLDYAYVLDGGKAWSVSKSGKYLPTGLVISQETWSRADGLEAIAKGPGGLRTVTTETAVDRANKKATVTTLDSEIGTASKEVYAGNLTLTESQEPFQYGTANKTSYDYDGNGRLGTITDALGRQTTITYKPQGSYGAGREDTRTLPGGGTITHTYNALGMVDTISGTASYYQHYGYNAQGRLETLTTHYGAGNSNATTTWVYDTNGSNLLYQKKDAANKSVTYGYNAAGWLASRRWARGPTTTYNYTKAGEINSVDYSDSTPDVIGMNYDKGGRLTTVIDISGSRTITYSDYDQRKNETYTGTGALSGSSIARLYSGDRRTGLQVGGPMSGYPVLGYSYDGARLSGISTQGDEVAVTYTPQAGMRQPQVVAGVFQSDGNLVFSHSVGYDSLGRLTRSVNAFHSTPLSSYGTTLTPIQYDSAGRRTEIPREDGGKWVYGYNTRDEVTSGVRRFSGGGPVPGHQFTYAYDGLGNRLTAASGGDQGGANLMPVSYTPNSLNQYTSLTNPASRWITGSALSTAQVFINGDWVWRNGAFFGKSISLGNGSGPNWKNVSIDSKIPPSGGGTTMTVATQSGNLLVPPQSVSPTYDDDGNLTNDGLWVYSWDGENRLKAMETVSGVPAAGQRKLEFAYDFEGRRVQATRYTKPSGSWVADAAGPTVFLYDGWNIIAEHNGSVTRHYIWGLDLSGTLDGAGGVGGLLAMEDVASGKLYWYASDANGNVTGLVDASNGTVAAQYEYGPFGEPLRASGPMAKVNPFRLSTKYTDNESGLVYYPGPWGGRNYKPLTGSWLSRDRYGERGGVNLYGFCSNDPIDSFDLLGMAGIKSLKAVFTQSHTSPGPNSSPTRVTPFTDKDGVTKNIQTGRTFDGTMVAFMDDGTSVSWPVHTGGYRFSTSQVNQNDDAVTPEGNWQVSTTQQTSGLKGFPIDVPKGRDGILIHDSEGKVGTHGCVGVTSDFSHFACLMGQTKSESHRNKISVVIRYNVPPEDRPKGDRGNGQDDPYPPPPDPPGFP